MAEAVVRCATTSTLFRASLHASSLLLIRYFILLTITLCFGFTMAESFSKKPKLMPTRAQRIRYSIQLEVEVEERLEGLKSKIQLVKSALCITSRTPMGNLLMMERLLSSFEEFEQSRVATTAGQSLFLQQPSPQTITSKKIDAQTQTDISDPYILAHRENTTSKFDIHTRSSENEGYFVSSDDAVRNLVSTMAQYGGMCPLCGHPLELPSFDTVQHGHVALASVGCVAGHSLRWNFSGITGGKYTANLR